MERKYVIAIILVIVVIVVAGVVIFGNTSHQRGDGELVVAAYSHGGEPETGFDPILGWNYYAEPLIQSTLLKMTPNMTYKNDLATNYTISDDYKEYVVQIRPNVKFTDGSDLTAEDVAFTYNEAKKSGQSLDLSSMLNATAVNDTTVKFTLNKSDSTFLDKMAYIGIVPSDSYNNESYGSNPIGSGPYKFVEWDKGQQVILEANPDYYGKKPEVKKLTILFAKNDAAFNAAKNNEADVVAVPLTYAKENVSGYTMYLQDSIDVRGVSLPNVNNTGLKSEEDNYTIGNNVTADIAVRKALNYGINRTAMCQGGLNGLGVPSYDGIAHQLPWSNNESAIQDGNITYANQTLESAGWKDTDGDGIREKNGTKAAFSVYYSSDAPERQALAVSLSEQAKQMGINITPVGTNWDEIYPNEYSQAVVWGYGSTDPSDIYSEYSPNSSSNAAMVNISAVNSHMDKAMSESREDSYKDWSAVSWDGSTGISPKGEASWLWLGEMKYGYFVNDRVDISNDTALLQPHGGDIFGNIYDWKMKNSTNSSA
ncbi:ABC transporter substrate-binding protein [Methanobrevibacter sp. AbM4]|uniref:ABC transporter substrate-binding protein n=1 Tax=Methanobrevibacter sp. AbM4 TaxID=224719 RepID=UPI0003348A39|nr:ABC transporter substrate-binding protein [Methanobrevibacter sp. AbM4]AGN16103.1 ABC transporter substrate-binding protein [Methanobrevibacter sp. AbM4]